MSGTGPRTGTRPTSSAAVEQGPSASPPPGERGSSASVLDQWERWPRSDPNFDPLFDLVQPLRGEFCECGLASCKFCSETRQVFHISEYTQDGRCVTDRKVNTMELHEHLKELEQFDKSVELNTPGYPSARVFFVCGNYTHDGLRYAYMRHFLAYCRMPPHFALRRDDADGPPVFQAAYEAVGTSDGTSTLQRGILHLYLQCFSYVADTDILAKPAYYSAEFEPKVRSWVQGGSYWPLAPSLYLRYDESSRTCVASITDSAMTFHAIRRVSSLGVRAANQDPFLAVAVFLQHRIAELQEYLTSKRIRMDRAISQSQKLSSLDAHGSDLFDQFGFLAQEGPNSARMRHETSSILRALRYIETEHRLFHKRNGNEHAQDNATRRVIMRFQRQHAQLVELESALASVVSGINIVKDLMVGRAQVLNGIDMATMAKDSQKQAEATEALARAARRDSEIMKGDSATMKTITVVTLVYLPATFVSTLLSMGIFDFGVGSDGDGRLRIAREGWLFLAISLPLTILTLGLAFIWKQTNERQWRREARVAEPPTANGNEAPEVPVPEPVEAADAAPASRRRLLAMFQGLRRRRGRGSQDVPRTDLEMGNLTARGTYPSG